MSRETQTISKFQILVSLSFWLTILVSCSLFGMVYLAPKVMAHEKLSEDYFRGQLRLIEKQNRVKHFRDVANALQTDSHFREEMQRVELGMTEPNSESFPVEANLSLDPKKTFPNPTTQRVAPWYVGYIVPFAVDPGFRRWSLIAAALSMFFAFVFLQEPASQKTGQEEKSSRSLPRMIFSRYLRG